MVTEEERRKAHNELQRQKDRENRYFICVSCFRTENNLEYEDSKEWETEHTKIRHKSVGYPHNYPEIFNLGFCPDCAEQIDLQDMNKLTKCITCGSWMLYRNHQIKNIKYHEATNTLIQETFCDECAEKKRRLEEEFGGR